MAQKQQNLKDYVDKLDTPKSEFIRLVCSKANVSYRTVERWCMLDSGTKNKLAIKTLTEITGISKENLFKRH